MNGRVLIVEDEQIVARDLEIKLNRMGYEAVGIASTGQEAIDLTEKEKPDVVLMDIQLEQRMLGTEAAKIIEERFGIPSIFITAFAGFLRKERPDIDPSTLCIGKPFSTVQLKEALETVLTKRSAQN